ncbi:6-carboxyhexanoate--CoA ligase [Geothermobacter hydrogeniphilus]|uniref:6-carboxyhexanoate--CoA ligase n=1 Tax=Geothermobacter hydrogeniphilus TaxID=1969733 RepID=A0A1X0YCN6_9BACT|nr:6-carboxyhexanoate--CoA ligase [Geothermobacter hydrogeniphilus]ORJ62887.1 6-carboxyhexanoate--CoA ligase [Geothermobacter hydrogeniphilus]
MTDHYYSVRMRSSRQQRHISGAERLVPPDRVVETGRELLRRAMNHSRGVSEQVHLSIDLVPAGQIREICLPPLETFMVADWRQGRQAAVESLVAAGVPETVAADALARLAAGPGPAGSSLRGAMLIDVADGRRLDNDSARGVRVSRMDISPGALARLRRRLGPLGLDNDHVREALVLAAKVLSAPGLVAELCWSDDPDYTAGYVAAPSFGYRRFPHLKNVGDERGGRVFFVRGDTPVAELVSYLERQPVLVTRIAECAAPVPWRKNA